MFHPIATLQTLLSRWWSEFTLQTRLMAAATLVVSLLMSGLTFWAVNTIQQDARLSDTRFGRDLGVLIASNAAPMVDEGNLTELARFSRQFYTRTSSLRYLLFAYTDGTIFYGIPFSEAEVQTSLTLRRRIQLPENYSPESDQPFARQHRTPNGQVTDVFVPLIHEGRYLGLLAVGTNPNPTAIASSNLTRDVTIAVFVSIWVMVILGAVFNALTITRPIKELLLGVKNIASGNFKQRIDLPLGGELGELIISFNDMAERLARYEEQNIEELTASKAKLETLVSTIADGALLLDTELRVVLVNPTARRIFGWNPEANGADSSLGERTAPGLGHRDVVGETVLYQFPPAVQVKLTRPLYQMLEGEYEATEEFRLVLHEPIARTIRILLSPVLSQRALDDEIPLCLTCAHLQEPSCTNPLQPEARECNAYLDQAALNPTLHAQDDPSYRSRESIKGIAITVQDITREVELNEAKSQFISNVSHELRAPLFNIKSFIETLHEYGDDLSDEQRREFLETANRETDRLTRLVNDVLDLSRLESNRAYTFDAVDLAQAIDQTCRSHQLTARDKNIELIRDLAPNLPSVRGNYDLLLQVFANLVGNALKFTPAGGRVAVRAYIPASLDATPTLWPACAVAPPPRPLPPPGSPPLEVVRVEVADTGIGIDPEDREAIFDRFFRVENRVHTLEGTGLGLSIVRNIIEKHQSTVRATSEVGVGTIFWFDLAVYPSEPSSNPPFNRPSNSSSVPAHLSPQP